MTEVSLAPAPFDPEETLSAMRRGNPKVGAIVTFTGLMRDINDGAEVSRLFLEHYPGMTEHALQAIVDEAKARWALEAVRVIHRVGDIAPEDPIVLVAAASRHRAEAFRACEFIIDYLKTRAPFWKKESTKAGDRWVEARASDAEARTRWHEG